MAGLRAPPFFCALSEFSILEPTPPPRIAPGRREPDSSRGIRRNRCISPARLHRDAAAPSASAGSPFPDRLRGTARRNCRSRSRSAPSSHAADLVQQVAERLLDRALRLGVGAIHVDLELALHEMHQLFVALGEMLVAYQRVVDAVER